MYKYVINISNLLYTHINIAVFWGRAVFKVKLIYIYIYILLNLKIKAIIDENVRFTILTFTDYTQLPVGYILQYR